jgi:hypothetical protein
MAIAATYPTFTYKGWVGTTPIHQPKCKCCAGDTGEELMEMLVRRAAGDKRYKGHNLSMRGMCDYLERTNRRVVKNALMNHMQKHVQIAKGGRAPVPASTRTGGENVSVTTARKEQAVRATVQAMPSVAETEDFRGPHVAYLEKVVKIAAAVVEEFPERVTPEMGIRASAEIAKMRQNDSRDALLDMLVQTAVTSPAKISRVGPAAVVRELDVGEVSDAEIVHESG